MVNDINWTIAGLLHALEYDAKHNDPIKHSEHMQELLEYILTGLNEE